MLCAYGEKLQTWEGLTESKDSLRTVVGAVPAVSTWKLLSLGASAGGDGQQLFAEI